MSMLPDFEYLSNAVNLLGRMRLIISSRKNRYVEKGAKWDGVQEASCNQY